MRQKTYVEINTLEHDGQFAICGICGWRFKPQKSRIRKCSHCFSTLMKPLREVACDKCGSHWKLFRTQYLKDGGNQRKCNKCGSRKFSPIYEN